MTQAAIRQTGIQPNKALLGIMAGEPEALTKYYELCNKARTLFNKWARLDEVDRLKVSNKIFELAAENDLAAQNTGA